MFLEYLYYNSVLDSGSEISTIILYIVYSSWEKWSVEIHNRYIRRYIPKWTDIRDYSEEYVEEIVIKINNLPRKIHWYRTPEEIYYWKSIKYFD